MKDIKDLRKEINEIDESLAKLFEKRMKVAKEIGEYKLVNNLAIFDAARENEVILKNLEYIEDEEIKKYYLSFIKEVMKESKSYQEEAFAKKDSENKVIRVDDSYEVIIGENLLDKIFTYIKSDKKVLIVSDDLIPETYIDKVAKNFSNVYKYSFKHGEKNKTYSTYLDILSMLTKLEFSRHDILIALGGGLTSDLAGFAASTFKRGIIFYVIPTTLLAMVDASIGGKVAINYEGYKNLVGSFYKPEKVIIDVSTLESLDNRLYLEGLIEAIKMAATSNKELFEFIENSKDYKKDIKEIIYRSLLIKKDVVEKDEKELGLRKVLNFGHTFGHAYEALGNGKYYHGEAVALGMLICSQGEAYERIYNLLCKLGLDIKEDYQEEEIMKYVLQDKKAYGEKITLCIVEEIGKFNLKDYTFEEARKLLREKKSHEK